MNFAPFSALFQRLVPHAPGLAEASSPWLNEVGVVAALLLTLTGMLLHLYLPRHQMEVEERVKDGDITEEEALRQMRFYRRCAWIVMAIGVTMLVVVLFEFAWPASSPGYE